MAIAGEEWRQMDAAKGVYDPGRYGGMLAEARRGIREHRMRDVELRLVKRDGQPLAGRTVEVGQLSHAFLFGDQVWELDAMIRDGRKSSGSVCREAYRCRFRRLPATSSSAGEFSQKCSMPANAPQRVSASPHQPPARRPLSTRVSPRHRHQPSR